tara:strand:+ start:171 stop:356 length:186 start_codon:yes stop_codon:yes gene_type:complete
MVYRKLDNLVLSRNSIENGDQARDNTVIHMRRIVLALLILDLSSPVLAKVDPRVHEMRLVK